jgi:signal transduction histidine kinase
MTSSFLRSLRARLIIGAVIWITIGTSAAGIFIANLFRQFTADLMDAELRNHLEELAMHIDIDPRGFPHLYRPLSDPRFSEIGSGFTWQVSRSGTSLIKSLSASTEELPVPSDALGADELRKVTIGGPWGQMVVFERMFLPDGGEEPPLRIQIGVDSAVLGMMLPKFDVPLTFSLALLALALMTAAALQVWFGLQPMARLRDALGAIKSGKAAQLPGNFPSEVQPLVDDLNNLIDVNAQMVMRARTQAGNLAHALKTPLAVMTDEADRMSSRGQGDSAAVVIQQCHQMQRQIDYQIARARAAASRSVPGIVAPVGVSVSNIIAAMRRLYAAKNLQIDTDIDARCLALCDPMDLNEMLANIIDNACKWASRTVAITASIEENKSQVVIVVKDDGPGLPANAIEVVFQVGERLDEQVAGSGLGLPIVRDLAQLYGGEIHLEPAATGGLKAILRLPQAAV